MFTSTLTDATPLSAGLVAVGRSQVGWHCLLERQPNRAVPGPEADAGPSMRWASEVGLRAEERVTVRCIRQ